MKRSFLEDLLKDVELEDAVRKEIVDSIMSENGKDLNNEKIKLETAKNDLKVKESLIDELNQKIKTADEIDIEKIKSEQFELGKAEGSKEFDDFKKTNALRNSIKGAKDFDLVMTKLNKDTIQYEKDEKGEYVVKGIEEQLPAIKEQYSYLFEDEQNDDSQDGMRLGGAHNNPTDNDELADLKKVMGIKD